MPLPFRAWDARPAVPEEWLGGACLEELDGFWTFWLGDYDERRQWQTDEDELVDIGRIVIWLLERDGYEHAGLEDFLAHVHAGGAP